MQSCRLYRVEFPLQLCRQDCKLPYGGGAEWGGSGLLSRSGNTEWVRFPLPPPIFANTKLGVCPERRLERSLKPTAKAHRGFESHCPHQYYRFLCKCTRTGASSSNKLWSNSQWHRLQRISMLSRSLTTFTNVSRENDGMPFMWQTSACLLYPQFSQPNSISFLYSVLALPRTIDHLASTDDGPLAYITSPRVMLSTRSERQDLQPSQYFRLLCLTGLPHLLHNIGGFTLRRLLNVAAQLLEQNACLLFSKSRVCFLHSLPHCLHETTEENLPNLSCWLNDAHDELQNVCLLCLMFDSTSPLRRSSSFAHLAHLIGILSCALNPDRKLLVKCWYCECMFMIDLYNNYQKLQESPI